MLIGRDPTPQGSGSSTRQEPICGIPASPTLPDNRSDVSPPITTAGAHFISPNVPRAVPSILAHNESRDVSEETSKQAAGCLQ
jgi:hypothetical protein